MLAQTCLAGVDTDGTSWASEGPFLLLHAIFAPCFYCLFIPGVCSFRLASLELLPERILYPKWFMNENPLNLVLVMGFIQEDKGEYLLQLRTGFAGGSRPSLSSARPHWDIWTALTHTTTTSISGRCPEVLSPCFVILAYRAAFV